MIKIYFRIVLLFVNNTDTLIFQFMSQVTKSFIKNFVYEMSYKNKMAEIKR